MERWRGGLAGGSVSGAGRIALEQAKAETDADVASLTAQHAQLEQTSSKINAKMQDPNAGAADATDRRTEEVRADGARCMGWRRSIRFWMTGSRRSKQLSSVYSKWIAQVELQHRILMHLILQSMAGVAGLILFAVLVWWLVQLLLDRMARQLRGRTGGTCTRCGRLRAWRSKW